MTYRVLLLKDLFHRQERVPTERRLVPNLFRERQFHNCPDPQDFLPPPTTTPPPNPITNQEQQKFHSPTHLQRNRIPTAITTMLPKIPQPSTEQVFPFLNLPTELRIQVYNLALPKKVRVRPVAPFAWSVNPYKDALALLRTSHQIRNEARPLLFSNSNFRIDLYDDVDALHFQSWIDGAGEGLISRMKGFEIGTSVEGQVVRFDVRVGEDGAIVTVVTCFDVDFLVRLCEVFEICLVEGDGVVHACERQRAVWSGVRVGGGEWKGYFSVRDMKMVVHAVGSCVELLKDVRYEWVTGGD